MNGVPGVKFVAESHEGWMPVVKRNEEKRGLWSKEMVPRVTL